MESVSLTQEYNFEYISNMNIMVDDNQDDDYNEVAFTRYISRMNSIQTTETTLNLYNKNLSNLLHIYQFTNLQILHCEYNNLRSIPQLPDTLVELHCTMSSVQNLPNLPLSLKVLSCAGNHLMILPPLNESLIILRCGDNSLITLPSLPDNLEFIDCHNNKITRLPPLNRNLRELVCHNNRISSLPPLNDKLLFLCCHNNRISSLPPLNIELKALFCWACNLISLPPLNDNLRTLVCGSNELSMLPNIDNLEMLDCSYNPINNIVRHYNNDIKVTKSRVKTLNRFRDLFHALKYKNKFRTWMMNVIEKIALIKYSPDNLEVVLMDVDDDDFQEVLDNWR